MHDKQLIIIGGGSSIQEGIQKDLWTKIEGKCLFGLNYSYHYIIPTVQFFVDRDFYEKERDNMKHLPLIIGNQHNGQKLLENTITRKAWGQYDPTLKKGVYKASLCGMYALSVACFLKPKEIFLLGYDFGGQKEKDTLGRQVTHFYQGEINHRGIGKTNYYNAHDRGNIDFKVYPSQHIYNVSLVSKINVFPKLSYDEFFNKLDNNIYNQDELRSFIKTKLQEV